MNEPKLIAPDGNIIDIPYFEMGLFCEKLCKNYIEQSEENKKIYEQFAQNYSYFKPYYDFVIFKLGYKIKNPFFQKDKIGYTIGNYFVVKDIEKIKESKTEVYTGVSDKDLQITNYKDVTLKEGFIDYNGIGFKLNRIAKIGHSKLCELLLNQYIIYNKEIYDDYMKIMNDPEMNKIITRIELYMVERLGFTHMCIFDTDFGSIIYNDKRVPSWFLDFQDIFEKEYNYVSFLRLSEEINLELESLNIEEVGEIYESRRI